MHRVLTRFGLARLAHLDRATGRVIRRYERDRPGELVQKAPPTQAQSAGPIPVTRSIAKAQVSDLGLVYCLDLSEGGAPSMCPFQAGLRPPHRRDAA